MKTRASLSDIRGLLHLAIDQAQTVTDVVEDMHATIARPFRVFRGPVPGRTGGIAGFVYRSIHSGYRLAASGLDAVLGRAEAWFDAPPSTPQREALIAVLNGIWGDTLASTGNPLAIEMTLRADGHPLRLDTEETESLHETLPGASRRILVMVHGLCMNDLQWERENHHYGAELAQDLGCTVVYLRYNSGLHISTNGRQFAALLEALVAAWPEPVEALYIVGHSMGGLVSRSAAHYGVLASHTWRGRLRKLICLGTPHHGSPWERIGNLADTLLDLMPITAPLRRLGLRRSAGITDLRYGNVIDEDWLGHDRFAPGADRRNVVALPHDVQCYAVAATVGKSIGDARDRLLGDGTVPLDSALGLHPDPDRCLDFPPDNRWIGFNTGHMELLNRPEIYAILRDWLAS